GLKGGTTLKHDEDAVLRQDRGPLFAGNLLASAYTEKDQLTVIGNAQNVDESNIIAVMSDDSGDRAYLNQGLSTAYQLGLNFNTSRIKDVETTVGTSYTFSDTDSGSKTSRTTTQEGGDLVSDDTRSGKQYNHKYAAELEFKKEKGKFWFRIDPAFYYRHGETDQSNSTQTRRAGALVNRSENRSRGQETAREASLNSSVTFRELGGKEKRNLRLTLNGSYNRSDGMSDENTVLQTLGGLENRVMRYDTDSRSSSASARLRYVEPLGEKWTVTAYAAGVLQRSDNVRDAFDAQGRNDAFSTSVNRRYLDQEYGLFSQYSFGENSWITLGVETDGVLDETRARTYGHESLTGQDEWNWFVMPQVEFEHNWGINRINFTISSRSSQPGNSRMLPALNISDPARLSLGNIYLKPFTYSYFRLEWRRNNREKFRTLMLSFTGDLRTRPLTEAQWYDADGVFCRLPVNARKPSLEMWSSFSYTMPLNAKKTWSLNLYSYITFNSAASYLAHGTVATPDKERFDYSAFMADFWGDASGDRFYGGKSGFEEYRTSTLQPYASASVKYNQERFSFDLTASASGYISRYTPSLDLDRNTLSTSFAARGSYTTRHEFEFESDLSYVTYRGYSDGFGQPEWQWNASISKNIGAFNLSLNAHDILNQTRSLSHTVAANYVEDSYRLVLGRYILFGIKWNFGKMNAIHNQRAQEAAWNMLW
ncbi:MAG: outer membrane beta-barrel family protein, partial [Oscillospiraceae bacterium]|nr:outer membrane beta-barrel family protein [Oscillospiraceae bacterium]